MTLVPSQFKHLWLSSWQWIWARWFEVAYIQMLGFWHKTVEGASHMSVRNPLGNALVFCVVVYVTLINCCVLFVLLGSTLGVWRVSMSKTQVWPPRCPILGQVDPWLCNRAEEEKQAAMDIKNMVPLTEAISSWGYYCLIPCCKDCSKNKKP